MEQHLGIVVGYLYNIIITQWLLLLGIELATGYTISLTPTRDEDQCKSANYTITDKVSIQYYLCVTGSHACAQL